MRPAPERLLPRGPPGKQRRTGGARRGVSAWIPLPRLPAELHSLRVRLFLSFGLLVLLALIMAVTVFVALRRGASDRETLDRLAAAAPQIALELRSLYDHGAGTQGIDDYVRQVSHDRRVRVLLVDWRDGVVAEDSGNGLRGKHLDLPDFNGDAPSPARGSLYRSWRGAGPDTGDLTFLVAGIGRAGRPFPLGRPGSLSEPGSNLIAVLAVPRQTIANAWLGLLPGLLWAGLVALGLSALMAGLLSRSIARPVLALTRASEEMAKGNFDQAVPLARPDEIGRLAVAFNSMAAEVGRSHLQTRALVANASHDLKTPLTSILGFAQALRDGAVAETAEVRELGGIIHEEAERILVIVEDLLYLSEIETGAVGLERAPVDLAELATRSLRRIEPLLRERGIRFEAEIDPALQVIGDAAKLERVLDNLLDNARKYTPAGGQIRLEAGQPSAGSARVAVHNSGSYIPEGAMPKLFDRFYRVDRRRGAATPGAGLGLAIVKELVELHEGRIEVQSGPEAGTTFALTLPAAGRSP